MTTTEDLVLHAAIWGPPDALEVAIEIGLFRPDDFTDPIQRRAAELIATGTHDPVTLALTLEAEGWDRLQARTAVILPGVFEAAGATTEGLIDHLADLDEDLHRRDIEAELVALADQLHRPGGIQKVRTILEDRDR